MSNEKIGGINKDDLRDRILDLILSHGLANDEDLLNSNIEKLSNEIIKELEHEDLKESYKTKLEAAYQEIDKLKKEKFVNFIEKKTKYTKELYEIIKQSNSYDDDGIRLIIDGFISEVLNGPDQGVKEAERIDLFYDEIAKILNNNVSIENIQIVSQKLNDLFFRYWEQLRQDFYIINDDCRRSKNEVIEKLKVSNRKLEDEKKSLCQDIYILNADKATLETKLKMVKILVENEMV